MLAPRSENALQLTKTNFFQHKEKTTDFLVAATLIFVEIQTKNVKLEFDLR